jgi:hypothetical protein
MEESTPRLSTQDLVLEGGELLPDKEVLSILDLFVNLDIALDVAAPVDLAVAANANVAAPIDAAAAANVLSFGSTATALAQQGVLIDQYISGEAIATAPQDAVIDQSNDVVDAGGTGGDAGSGSTVGAVIETDGTGGDLDGVTEVIDTGGTGGDLDGVTEVIDTGGTGGDLGGAVTESVDGAVGDSAVGGLLAGGPMLNVQVDAAIDANLAAPIAGAVAANANVAAPIDAAVAANIASFDSNATAIADQTAIINQNLDDVTASATAAQEAEITQ